MEESSLPELDFIDGLVTGIRDHWEHLNTPYWPLGFEPAPFYLPWLEQYFGDDWLDDEKARRALAESPAVMPTISIFIPVLEQIVFSRPPELGPKGENVGEYLRRNAARNVLDLARKALKGPLDDAELNELGWKLTELVARGSEPIKEALRQVARIAGQKGGRRSADQRKSQFEQAAAATCSLAQKLQDERQRAPANLVNILATRLGLSKPTIRNHLRQGGLYPDPKGKRNKPS